MTREGALPEGRASRHADTEVFYMAGKQLAALARRLLRDGWPADAPCSVVSRAGWPDALHSDHMVADLAQAAMLHAGRPSVVTVGAGAGALRAAYAIRSAAWVESNKSTDTSGIGPETLAIDAFKSTRVEG